MDIQLLIEYDAPPETLFEAAKKLNLPYYTECICEGEAYRYFFLTPDDKILYLRTLLGKWKVKKYRHWKEYRHTKFGARAVNHLKGFDLD